ncbi:G2/M phase-specific E3 ubiquitin-protein ligase-like [Polyodon spathula]|uniref:G2/M phase-specific E3 ubiquitin-protein ligase-like n=1 Tax=Polyodon spathula TaxID=7913 RepID=UPI001B7E2EC4|nr:G2/M phase-specific E3 ubiquitin-protein ligase-like [Polyodon spathula]
MACLTVDMDICLLLEKLSLKVENKLDKFRDTVYAYGCGRSKFNTDRRNVWDGAIPGFRRKIYRSTSKISVTFMDLVGKSEDAVDQGGPTRESLNLTMQCLKNNKLFESSDNSKNLTCDSQAMREDEYFLAGRVMGVSLVHGGPAPKFVSKKDFNLVYFILEASTTVSFKQILSFITGADKKPPLGFQPPPSIAFLHEINTEGSVSKFPEANSCCNILKLPILNSYVDFKKNMDFGILSCPGFGQA